jgi:hypothetical protein
LRDNLIALTSEGAHLAASHCLLVDEPNDGKQAGIISRAVRAVRCIREYPINWQVAP